MNNLPETVVDPSTSPQFASLLCPEALAFIATLHREFEDDRQQLFNLRQQRQAQFNAGALPDFLPETAHIREADWQIAPLPEELRDRRVEITAPAERRAMINAMNSGASVVMVDLEDAFSPGWRNILQGHQNVRDIWHDALSWQAPDGRQYECQQGRPVTMLRIRGLHLTERHLKIDNKPVNAGLFDFALSFFHSAAQLQKVGRNPYYYLPKLESHLEARWWNALFERAQQLLALPAGWIKATVMIEDILAAFEMDEILYELRAHSAGLNAGRWDYIFSCIRHFRRNTEFCLANRDDISMTVPFMRSYSLLLVKTCHRRGAPAIGGISALLPIKHDPSRNEKALAMIYGEKQRDVQDGYDGCWVAHPSLVPLTFEAFRDLLGEETRQWHKQRDDVLINAHDLLNFQPEWPITEQGLRNNINVGIQYLGAWLGGNGCVPIHNQLEEAATAEIARTQIWQWIRSHKGRLDDGRKVTVNLFRDLAAEEINKLRAEYGSRWLRHYDEACQLFDLLISNDDFVEFFPLAADEYLA